MTFAVGDKIAMKKNASGVSLYCGEYDPEKHSSDDFEKFEVIEQINDQFKIKRMEK